VSDNHLSAFSAKTLRYTEKKKKSIKIYPKIFESRIPNPEFRIQEKSKQPWQVLSLQHLFRSGFWLLAPEFPEVNNSEKC
jgi:hypothetical protein